MHPALETLEKFGLVSELHLLDIESFEKKKVINAYEQLYLAVHKSQNELPEPDEPTVDPFMFMASASMRAESTCWEWPCRLQKLDFLARYGGWPIFVSIACATTKGCPSFAGFAKLGDTGLAPSLTSLANRGPKRAQEESAVVPAANKLRVPHPCRVPPAEISRALERQGWGF